MALRRAKGALAEKNVLVVARKAEMIERLRRHDLDGADEAAANSTRARAVAAGLLEKVLPHVLARRRVIVSHAAVLARARLGEDILANVDIGLEAVRARKEDLIGDALDERKEAVPTIIAVDEEHVRRTSRRRYQPCRNRAR